MFVFGNGEWMLPGGTGKQEGKGGGQSGSSTQVLLTGRMISGWYKETERPVSHVKFNRVVAIWKNGFAKRRDSVGSKALQHIAQILP